jgi:hypothetical protein
MAGTAVALHSHGHQGGCWRPVDFRTRFPAIPFPPPQILSGPFALVACLNQPGRRLFLFLGLPKEEVSETVTK